MPLFDSALSPCWHFTDLSSLFLFRAQTQRTACECLKQYRGRIGQRRQWSEAEDATLREAVIKFGENWQSGVLFRLPLSFPLYTLSIEMFGCTDMCVYI